MLAAVLVEYVERQDLGGGARIKHAFSVAPMWYGCTRNPLTSKTVTLTASPDGPLALARRRLDDAVHALADPVPVWAGGVCRWSDSVYVRLRVALRGAPVSRTAVYHRSKPPCRFDVLALLVSNRHRGVLVGTGRQGHGGAASPVGWPRLAAPGLLADRHVQRRDRAVDTVGGRADHPELRVFLREPCPRCGERWAVRRDSAGELVRVRVLKVSETGCKCQACGASWGPDRFEWLARLLGCPALPA